MSHHATAAILLIIGAFCYTVRSQDDTDFTVFRGADEATFRQLSDQERLAFAAKSEEMQIVELTGASQSASAQEDVSLSIDCLPWLRRFPGGSIQWSFVQLDEFGDLMDPNAVPTDLAPNAPTTDRIVIGGDFNRWLNITSVVVIQGAEDPDSKVFFCEVCIARGTPFEMCHTSNYTSRTIGSPPQITQESRIFCVTRNDTMANLVDLDCDLTDTGTTVFPIPQRTWTRNGVPVYTANAGDNPDVMEFVMNNTVLMLGVLEPQVFSVLADGSIVFQPNVVNITTPSLIPDIPDLNAATNAVFNLLLGSWTCNISNNLGGEAITYTVRECGESPVIPTCVVNSITTIFPDDQDVIRPGCDVCIPEGESVILDCTVSAGALPISYNWTNDEGASVSQNAMLLISDQGNYTCTAQNPDAIQTSVVSVLHSPAHSIDLLYDVVTPSFQITTNIQGMSGNGCGRLVLSRLNDTAEMEELMRPSTTCVFLGETLDVSCNSNDPNAVLELSMQDGTAFANSSISITVTEATISNADMTFMCRITSVDGPCGEFPLSRTVRVFDPARIDRVIDITTGRLTTVYGAGRDQDVVQQDINTTFSLFCPTTGITEEETVWTQVTEDQFGCFSEVVINSGDSDGRFTLEETVIGDVDVLALTINMFMFEDEGTFVCRTENVAGNDADVVSVLSSLGTPEWDAGGFGECDVRCADGIRRQSLVCRNSRSGLILPDAECNNENRPEEEQSCSDLYPSPCLNDPIWVPGPWGPCTQGCAGGFRTRQVDCIVPMTNEEKSKSQCYLQPMPSLYEFCMNTCCKEDTYPVYCDQSGTSRCGEAVYQQFCCWTCRLTEINW